MQLKTKKFSLVLAIVFAFTIGATMPVGQAAVYHVDVNNPACLDAPGSGSEAQPFCSVKYVATIAKPGDTFLVQSGIYPTGPNNFTKSGTATAPITYRAVGYVTFATQVADDDFQPTDVPNVYSKPYAATLGALAQRRYPPVLVDDPNQSEFTMVQEDGPLRLNYAPDDATLAAQEGMYILSGGVLRVHPYGNVAPSTTATDFIASGGIAAFNVSASYNVFDGFTVIWSASFAGNRNAYRNMTFQTQPFTLGGNNSDVENLTVSHVIMRMADGNWLWHWRGQGGGGGMSGSGHRLKNIHVFHNWNSSFSSEGSYGGVVDGARLHGAPNHCSVLANGNTTIRNVIWYNCQDFQWITDPNGLVLENVTLPGGGIAISAVARTNGPITIRNSIFKGTFHFVRGTGDAALLPFQGCTWEKGSLMENNVIAPDAKIERCNTQISYPIAEYMARCASGEFTDCMTIRNNRVVPIAEWKTVVKDGMWTAALGDKWDVSLVAGSPAIDAGVASGATTDIVGTLRPQGAAFDIGAYESAAVPVDCQVSEWSDWLATGPWVIANWAQSRSEERTRTVTTQPSNGGAACPVLHETRTVTQSCTSVTITSGLVVSCIPQ